MQDPSTRVRRLQEIHSLMMKETFYLQRTNISMNSIVSAEAATQVARDHDHVGST